MFRGFAHDALCAWHREKSLPGDSKPSLFDLEDSDDESSDEEKE